MNIMIIIYKALIISLIIGLTSYGVYRKLREDKYLYVTLAACVFSLLNIIVAVIIW